PVLTSGGVGLFLKSYQATCTVPLDATAMPGSYWLALTVSSLIVSRSSHVLPSSREARKKMSVSPLNPGTVFCTSALASQTMYRSEARSSAISNGGCDALTLPGSSSTGLDHVFPWSVDERKMIGRMGGVEIGRAH